MLEGFLLLLGFALLIGGAELLIYAASKLAQGFHISEFIIGLTVVAIGTSLPELFIGIEASFQKEFAITIGNVVGSNICALLFILGLATLLNPITFEKNTRRIELPLCIFVNGLLYLFCLTNGVVDRIEAGILLTLFVLFLIYLIMTTKKGKEQEENKTMSVGFFFVNFILIIISAFCLKIGSTFVIDHATALADRFHISSKIISLTLIALGTSLPEIFTTLVSAKSKKHNIAVGNVIGSVIMNTLLIIGVSAMINPIEITSAFHFEFIILLIASLLISLFTFLKPKHRMMRTDGAILIGVYVLYLMMLCWL